MTAQRYFFIVFLLICICSLTDPGRPRKVQLTILKGWFCGPAAPVFHAQRTCNPVEASQGLSTDNHISGNFNAAGHGQGEAKTMANLQTEHD